MLRFVVILVGVWLASSPAAAEPKRWAVLVGVDDYAGFVDLKYCGRDAEALADTLRHSGFDDDAVVVLHDGARDARYRPIKANVEKELDIVLSLAGPDDLVIVSFSGHGMHVDGRSYFCPTEADDARPNETMIAVDDVYQRFGRCPAAFKLLLVDACRNDPRPAGRKSVVPDEERRSLATAFERPPDGIVVMSSCAAGQISWEDEKLQHGVFMHHVLRGLSGDADGNKNGRVTLGELYDYAGAATKTYVARNFRDVQIPAQRGEVNGVFELPRSSQPEEIVNSYGMKLRLVPAGEFSMGSPPLEADRGDDETRHKVRITRPFYIGVHEVTRGQFAEFVAAENYKTEAERDGAGGFGVDEQTLDDAGPTPRYSWRTVGFPQNDAHPVTNVSWNDAQEFCRRLSAVEGRNYRLPTEAEWEYACRGGSTTAFPNGETRERLALIANTADAAYAARKASAREWALAADDGYVFTAPVGSYQPNTLGLYDMIGNVWEWCGDAYDANYYAESPAADPPGPAAGRLRVVRGGGWAFAPEFCRSAKRFVLTPSGRNYAVGFRVVLVP